MSYYVDIPQIHDPASDDNSWVNVAVTRTRRGALAILLNQWGIPANQAAPFITKGEGDLRKLYEEVAR